MAARKKAGGQTPEPTNRNHIGCSFQIKGTGGDILPGIGQGSVGLEELGIADQTGFLQLLGESGN